MKNSFSKIRNLLITLLLLAITGCGSSGVNSGSLSGGATLTTKVVSLSSDNVKKFRIMVTGPDIPTARQDFSIASTMTIEVYPGHGLIVTVQALGDNDVVLFEGFATDVTIAPNAENSVTVSMNPLLEKAADKSCIGCHETTRDITGQNLVADFKQSGHYTNQTWVAFKLYSALGVKGTGCAGCHGPLHNDLTPATSGRCFECHKVQNNSVDINDKKHYDATSWGTQSYGSLTARYLNLDGTNCSACHEPHNPTNGAGKQERKDWAASGHGDVSSTAWAHFNFSIRDTCNACHTPVGFLKARANGWTDTKAIVADITESLKQPLTCDGCHSSNNFKKSVRTLSAGYKAGMGGFGSDADAFIQYPNVGESNICIPCHASSENGASLIAGTTDFTNANFKNPHYLGAAAVFYGKGGFQFYTSGVRYNTYGAAGKVGRNANWSHGKLGMDNYSAAEGVPVPGVIIGTGNKGQCIACHLGPNNNHLFSAATTATDTQGNSGNTAGCYGCHNSTTETVAEFLDIERFIWDRMFDFFAWNFSHKSDGTLRANPIYYSSTATPFFFSDAARLYGLTDWTLAVPGGTGAQTMGSAMNLKLLSTDKGSFMHNRNFGRALIADSIVYLQKGTVGDRSVVSPTQNGVITFSAYSSAFPEDPNGKGVSITTLKSRLTRSVTGGFIRR